MSAVRQIYTTLARMPVLLNGEVVRSHDVSALPPSLSSGQLPARLLMPLGTRPEGRSISFASVAQRRMRVVWTVTDLLLHTPAAQSRLPDVAPLLLDYQAAYLCALTRIKWPNPSVALTELGFVVGIYAYPADGPTSYYGVEATLTIQEMTNP